MELKPCPFCGSKPEMTVKTYIRAKEYVIGCSNDECAVIIHTSPKKNEKIASEAWNRRV